MKAFSTFLIFLFLPLSLPFCEALAATVDSTSVELGKVEGWIVDSVTVAGNSKTKDFAILREMELQPGSPLRVQILDRDKRYLHGLGLFADVTIEVDSLRQGGCALRINVKERSSYFLKTILPILNYDFNKGFSYGLKWRNRNFRGRRESISASYMRNPDNDNNASISWFAPWIGWKRFELGSAIWIFDRGEIPSSETVLNEWGSSLSLGIPLTSSRINFSQLLFRLSFEGRETGSIEEENVRQEFLSPLVGIRLDSRDSYLMPLRGSLFFLAVRSWRSVAGKKQNYYTLWNDLRLFRTLTRRLVLAMQTNLTYQFGEFPDYSYVGLGGSGTLRGYPGGEFRGRHEWFQTVEWRALVMPRKVFKLPFLSYVDITLAMVFFVDSGIAWTDEKSFNMDRFHGAGGFGLRLYSPFQDVVRIDLGFNGHGGVYPYLRTGIRF